MRLLAIDSRGNIYVLELGDLGNENINIFEKFKYNYKDNIKLLKGEL